MTPSFTMDGNICNPTRNCTLLQLPRNGMAAFTVPSQWSAIITYFQVIIKILKKYSLNLSAEINIKNLKLKT
jgi:hypothetical protein